MKWRNQEQDGDDENIDAQGEEDEDSACARRCDAKSFVLTTRVQLALFKEQRRA